MTLQPHEWFINLASAAAAAAAEASMATAGEVQQPAAVGGFAAVARANWQPAAGAVLCRALQPAAAARMRRTEPQPTAATAGSNGSQPMQQ